MPLIVILLHQRIAARQLRRHRSEPRARQRIGHIIGVAILFADQRISQLRLAKRREAQASVRSVRLPIAVISFDTHPDDWRYRWQELIRQFCCRQRTR